MSPKPRDGALYQIISTQMPCLRGRAAFSRPFISLFIPHFSSHSTQSLGPTIWAHNELLLELDLQPASLPTGAHSCVSMESADTLLLLRNAFLEAPRLASGPLSANPVGRTTKGTPTRSQRADTQTGALYKQPCERL